ncbi:AAA family ATPase [Paenibacillus harenae]|uniref:AAA family ATPase n=1 Tax=Paenibacillus harenae TaxID=306543 RepID=UPI0003F7AD24|nr:AAA family ATPase [Paenibacillus harenae]
MIVWINGAFGAGKTQTAFELHRRTVNSYVFDPENAGYYMQKNMPKGIRKDDFQHYPMWRETNYAMLKYLDENYDGLLIAPMTVVDPAYFQEMVGRLRDNGVVVHHFALCASEDVIRKRLRGRGERNNSWAEQQISRCAAGLADDIFQQHIDTDHSSIKENVERIAASANIELFPDRRGVVKQAYDRVLTQIRHIRL